MKTYQVFLSNGASVMVRAHDADEAKTTAVWQAKRDGFAGVYVISVHLV